MLDTESKEITNTTTSNTLEHISKYNISAAASALSEEAKTDIIAALKRAESRITPSTVISHWRELVISLLVISVFVMYYRMQAATTELATKNETYNRLVKIDGIDSTLKTVTDNQKNLYPQMDTTIKQLESVQSQLRTQAAQLKVVSQAQSRKAAGDLTAEELAKGLSLMGYPITVTKEIK